MLRFWSPHLYVYYILYCFVVTSLSLFNGISLFDQKNIPTALSGSFRTLGLITENRRNETAVNVADCSWQVAKERGQKKEKERERERIIILTERRVRIAGFVFDDVDTWRRRREVSCILQWSCSIHCVHCGLHVRDLPLLRRLHAATFGSISSLVTSWSKYQPHVRCLNCEKLAGIELFDGRSPTKIVM